MLLHNCFRSPVFVAANHRGSASLLLSMLMLSLLSGRAQNPAAGTESQPAVFGSLPDHPRLLLNQEGLAKLQKRIRDEPWARKTWNGLKREIDRSLHEPIALPPRGGNWSHNYVCPEHGSRLERGRRVGEWKWEHHCPTSPHLLLGDPTLAARDFDGNGIAQEHGSLAAQTVYCGLLYQVTREEKYAERSREILLGYAGRYLSYPLHNNQGRLGTGGRVASQSLSEAGWISQMAKGADLVWTTLTPGQQSNLVVRLFRPALDEIIIPRPNGIHNIQCHRNSAIGLVGFLLGDDHLIDLAINDPKLGFHQQLAQGVTRDGLWYEGSSGYHFYTISGLWPLAQAAYNCGVDLFTPAFRSMFDGPLRLAMPNGVLPNFNDSNYVELARQADLYEIALAHWPAPEYANLVQQSKREGLIPLLYGLTPLPTGRSTRPSVNRNLPDSGYAILQRGKGSSATWLCLKYGPHGGGHGHPDKNNVIIYHRDRVVSPDSGTHAYGSPLHKGWDKTTLAHNTLVVDQANQAQTTGRLLALGSTNEVDYCMAQAGSIYPGLTFTRTVALLKDDLILFIDQVEAKKESLFDLVYHQEGQWERDTADGTAWSPPDLPGYNYLTQTFSTPATTSAENLRLRPPAFGGNDAGARTGAVTSLILAPDPAAELITGYGILKTTKDITPVLIQRVRAQAATYVWAVSLGEQKVLLTTHPLRQPSGDGWHPKSKAVLARVSSAGQQWSLAVNLEGLPLRETPPGCVIVAPTAGGEGR